MNVIEADFPFEEIRDANGDLFNSPLDAIRETGLDESHIWSVVSGDGDEGESVWTFGPSHHYVNVLGFVATAESHDGNTYYEEVL